jgi:hypothetical protein
LLRPSRKEGGVVVQYVENFRLGHRNDSRMTR